MTRVRARLPVGQGASGSGSGQPCKIRGPSAQPWAGWCARMRPRVPAASMRSSRARGSATRSMINRACAFSDLHPRV